MSERLESEDVNANWARALAIALAISVVVIAGLTYFFYAKEIGQWRGFNNLAVENKFRLPKVDAYASNSAASADTPPTYRWNDDKKTAAEIPVARALELAAKNQLIKLDLDSSMPTLKSPETKQ